MSVAGNKFMIKSDMTGMPDIIALKDKVLYAVEVKAPGGRISLAQYEMLKSMHVAGAVCCIVVDINNFYADKYFMLEFLRVY